MIDDSVSLAYRNPDVSQPGNTSLYLMKKVLKRLLRKLKNYVS